MDLLAEAQRLQPEEVVAPSRVTRLADRVWRAMMVVEDVARLREERGEVLRALMDEGFEVHVLGPPGAALDALEAEGVEVVALPVDDWRNVPALVGALVIAQAHMIEHPAALVHASGGPAALIGALAARVSGATASIVTLEDLSWRGWPETLGVEALAPLLRAPGDRVVGALSTSLVRAFGALADQLIVTSTDALDVLEAAGAVDPARVDVMRGGMGVALERFDADADGAPGRASARARFEIPEAWRQVVGALDLGARGVSAREVRQLVLELSRSHPGVGWLIRRAPDQPPSSLAAHPAVIEVALADDELLTFYAAIDLLALPARAGLVPLRALEAGAMRAASVAYDHPGAAGVIRPGETGELVAFGDTRALARQLIALLDAPSKLYDMARRARPHTVQGFSRAAAQAQLLRIYDAVMTRQLQREG